MLYHKSLVEPLKRDLLIQIQTLRRELDQRVPHEYGVISRVGNNEIGYGDLANERDGEDTSAVPDPMQGADIFEEIAKISRKQNYAGMSEAQLAKDQRQQRERSERVAGLTRNWAYKPKP